MNASENPSSVAPTAPEPEPGAEWKGVTNERLKFLHKRTVDQFAEASRAGRQKRATTIGFKVMGIAAEIIRRAQDPEGEGRDLNLSPSWRAAVAQLGSVLPKPKR